MTATVVHAWQADPVIAAIRAELARKGVSAASLPKLIGGSQAYWGRRMIGDTEFSVGDLRALARLLEVPVAKFFENDENAPRPQGPKGVKNEQLPRLDSNQEPSGLLQSVVIDMFTRERFAS